MLEFSQWHGKDSFHKFGVAQGSILEPILFDRYNGMFNHLSVSLTFSVLFIVMVCDHHKKQDLRANVPLPGIILYESLAKL